MTTERSVFRISYVCYLIILRTIPSTEVILDFRLFPSYVHFPNLVSSRIEK